ncbi:unnamed protein product [Agarophyton chilense]
MEASSRTRMPLTITRLETAIVCLSFTFTVISVFLRFAARVNPKEPLTTPLGNLLTIFTIALISFISLIMASTNVISLDAMAVATIGLLPALDSFRQIKFTELQLRWHIFRIVYGGTDGIFFFYQLSINNQTALDQLSNSALKIIFYPYQTALTRRLQRFRALISFFSFPQAGEKTTNLSRFLEDESCAQKYEVLDTDEFWAGEQLNRESQPSIALEPKLVVIRHYGSTWFAVEKILAGHSLLRQPSKILATNGDSVLKALSALTEIVLIGDLCRLLFAEEIGKEYELIRTKKNHQDAVSFCNETFRQLGLEKLWQFNVAENEERIPECASERYDIFRTLFIVITFHSKLFLQVKSPWENVHKALRNGANGEPMDVLKRCVRRWFESYDYSVDVAGVSFG